MFRLILWIVSFSIRLNLFRSEFWLQNTPAEYLQLTLHCVNKEPGFFQQTRPRKSLCVCQFCGLWVRVHRLHFQRLKDPGRYFCKQISSVLDYIITSLHTTFLFFNFD